MTTRLFWRLIAWIVTRECIKWRLIRYAMRTPYVHIMSADGSETYMLRYWVFNSYKHGAEKDDRRWKWLPSIRVPDRDRHLHNHPWRKARTIILNGWYLEELGGRSEVRFAGETNELLHDTFHKIEVVSRGGVWTLFFTWGVGQDWGFLVDDGSVVPHREYLNER